MENSAPAPAGRPGVRWSRAGRAGIGAAEAGVRGARDSAPVCPKQWGPDAASPLTREPPELRFVEQRDPVALLAQPLDLHELQPRLAARRLLRIGASADDDRRPDGRHAVDHGPGAF